MKELNKYLKEKEKAKIERNERMEQLEEMKIDIIKER